MDQRRGQGGWSGRRGGLPFRYRTGGGRGRFETSPTHNRREGWGRQGHSRPSGSRGRLPRGASGATHTSSTPTRPTRHVSDAELEMALGFQRHESHEPRLGWLFNMSPTSVQQDGTEGRHSALDFYFIEQDGNTFKATKIFEPYFYVQTKVNTEHDVEAYLRRKYEGIVLSVLPVAKEDLEMPNHLSNLQRVYLQLKFRNVGDLMAVRKDIMSVVQANKKRMEATAEQSSKALVQDYSECITDIREYDVPYYVRGSIDLGIHVGLWYTVAVENGATTLTQRPDLLERAEPRICAFDIETTKVPLKFPDARSDQIMMISYMLNKQGYLIVNRQIVAEDIMDFEYTPKPEYEGPFHVFNEPDEAALLRRWLSHMREARPAVYVTYNGDFFDWPFVEMRCTENGINLTDELGIRSTENDEYRCRCAVNMDCFNWVKRDSYLPHGSHGLKAVTRAKLGYDPLELDPEDMTPFAREKPQVLAQYSVSDAVATYYLYMKYVHPFIFSLCTIIPMNPDDVLRKGSGTLCEQLLMVQSYKMNIICPNKQIQDRYKMYDGHLLESETYIGGHVECLESGVFRNDIPCKFRMDPTAYQMLIDDIDRTLQFAIQEEGKISLEKVTNYDAVRSTVVGTLEALRDTPNRLECPLIYHLDVGAMYPNIILTNRLQPPSTVTKADCAACDFNHAENRCQRRMEWTWRGDYFPATRTEYEVIKTRIEYEQNDGGGGGTMMGTDASYQLLKKRLKEYCHRTYRKNHVTKEEKRDAIICQRENPFYVDTVRLFRDRRYEYKRALKTWVKKLEAAQKGGESATIQEAKNMVVLYESLQLAHKCILNSFYGYVMRKGSRWYSMEMAGVVTHTGANIIKEARKLVERIGRPLELDTDGIWCALPSSFPENYTIEHESGRYTFSFPCVMLNVDVKNHFANDQYQRLVDAEKKLFETTTECSIFFEVDGPYKAMILPASTEEGKLLKKRYAVFNMDGSLAELKGFEVKRRGELKLIKIFQSQVFECFLEGTTLEECFTAVGRVANQWLDVLFSKGAEMDDAELFELLSESRSMSNALEEYGSQKSTSITTARRLAEFLGDQMVKDKGLACNYIIARKPEGAPVSERAVPVAIFNADPGIMRSYLRRWCRDNSMFEFDLRFIIDWEYYITRFGSSVQKIISIPAAIQRVRNPVPRIPLPDWLCKRIRASDDKFKQARVTDTFYRRENVVDIESIGEPVGRPGEPNVPIVRHHKRAIQEEGEEEEEEEEEEKEKKKDPPSVSMDEDYQGWLATSKTKWRKQVAERKRRRMLGLSHVPARGSMNAFVQHQSDILLQYHWQLLQVAETRTPGMFKVWAILGNSLLSVLVTVPRVFYINYRHPEESCQCYRRVKRVLPRNRPCLNLYEVTMSEDRFVDTFSKELSAFVTHPDVESIYETKTPPLMRAICSLGCVCQVSEAARTRGVRDRFSLLDLDFKTETECPYLRDTSVRTIFFYESGIDQRGLFGLFHPDGRQANVILVSPFRKSDNPNLIPMLRGLDTTVTHFTLDVVKSRKLALHVLQRQLVELHRERQGPTIVVIQALTSVREMTDAVPILSEFPIVSWPANQSDNTYPPLGWQLYAAKRVMKRYIYMPQWLEERINFARYAHVPLGNLERDYMFVGDVFFGRQLRDRRHLWWMSESLFPDLGGAEEDDNAFVDEQVNPDICTPGAYRNACVELNMAGLAVDAILESHHLDGSDALAMALNAMEGNAEAQTLSVFDESMAVAPAFQVMRALVQLWLDDVTQSQNHFADTLLLHFYRWVRSATSRFHDPALHRMVHGMMRKVFTQLIAEMKCLGCTIVYASFNKIIVSTSKTSIKDAQAHCAFLIETIIEKDVFKYLSITPGQYWLSLLFMDRHNYGGILAQTNAENDFTTETITKPDIVSNWNIADYLPVPIQDAFLVLVSEFVYLPFKHRNSLILSSPSKKKQEVTESEGTYLRQMIGTHFARKLFKIIPDIKRNLSGDSRSGKQGSSLFPTLPGSHLPLHDPALEFVKSIMYVFSLDPTVDAEVTILRKNLMRQMGVREFAPDTEFKNPCLPFVLPDVICTYCNSCHDIDLCRDPQVLDGSWCCSECQHAFDKRVVEAALVQIVQKRSVAYQAQDLRCAKCRQVKGDNMSEYCKCSGVFECIESSASLEKSLHAFHNIAVYHKFEWLQEVVEWITTLNVSDS